MRCPIRGHDHDLVIVKEHTQQGTGAKGYTFECQLKGYYRWFHVKPLTEPVSPYLRMKRPRWGWKD